METRQSNRAARQQRYRSNPTHKFNETRAQYIRRLKNGAVIKQTTLDKYNISADDVKQIRDTVINQQEKTTLYDENIKLQKQIKECELLKKQLKKVLNENLQLKKELEKLTQKKSIEPQEVSVNIEPFVYRGANETSPPKTYTMKKELTLDKFIDTAKLEINKIRNTPSSIKSTLIQLNKLFDDMSNVDFQNLVINPNEFMKYLNSLTYTSKKKIETHYKPSTVLSFIRTWLDFITKTTLKEYFNKDLIDAYETIKSKLDIAQVSKDLTKQHNENLEFTITDAIDRVNKKYGTKLETFFITLYKILPSRDDFGELVYARTDEQASKITDKNVLVLNDTVVKIYMNVYKTANKYHTRIFDFSNTEDGADIRRFMNIIYPKIKVGDYIFPISKTTRKLQIYAKKILKSVDLPFEKPILNLRRAGITHYINTHDKKDPKTLQTIAYMAGHNPAESYVYVKKNPDEIIKELII